MINLINKWLKDCEDTQTIKHINENLRNIFAMSDKPYEDFHNHRSGMIDLNNLQYRESEVIKWPGDNYQEVGQP